MASASDVLRATASRFLPLLVALSVGGLVAAALTSRNGLASLREVNWPLVPVRSAVVSAGFLAALLAGRRRLGTVALRSGRRSALAAALAVLALLTASLVVPRALVQRGGLAVGLALDLTVGAAAALAAFVASGRGARGSARAS